MVGQHVSGEVHFAAVPARACADKRLTGGHWRVLAVIAYHDRFNRNNRGCYITHQKMAEFIGSSRSSVTEWIRDLYAWGYVDVLATLNKDRRREAYTIQYDPPENTPTTNECTEPGTDFDKECPEMGQSMS